MKIPIMNLGVQYEQLKADIDRVMRHIAETSNFVLGKETEEFEKEIAAYCGTKYAIGVNSGTDALILALEALGIRGGDEVITTPFTFFATAEAISRVDAKPVFADIDPVTYNIDPAKIESAVTGRTRAILPVHLFGNPCDMEAITKIANKHRFAIVEDTAQAIGAVYRGRRAGSFGDAGCFSFFPSKNLGAYGDGGAIITGSREMKKRYLFLREYGQRKKYHHVTMGRNSRLDEIQASILRIKLKYLDRWNEKRQQAARYYQRLLQSFDPDVIIPRSLSGRQHVFHLYVIRLKKRTQLIEYLAKRNIRTAIHYPIPLHLQQTFKYLGYRRNDLPVSEKLSGELLSLPMYPEIKRNDIREVADNIRSFYGL